MSDELEAPEGVRLGTYCGPASLGNDRRLWAVETDGNVTLDREDVYLLLASLAQSLRDHPAPR